MSHLVKNKQPLLDKFGRLSEPGYSTKEIFEYNPEMILASKWRIKEWDYYAVLSKNYGFSFTIADLGYLGLISVNFFDFEAKTQINKSKKVFFPFGKLKLPRSIEDGDLIFNKKGFLLKFLNDNGERRLIVEVNRFYKRQNLRLDIVLKKKEDDHMTIATPWKENRKAFYYNQKINCMPAVGDAYIQGKHYEFRSDRDYGVLDWGRGVWTYKNTWYWGSASGVIKGKRFGFNIGYGFGDTSKATENMLFYDGKAHKLDLVRFEFNPDNYMDTWYFTSNDQRFELEMKPLIDRQDKSNLIIIKNKGHQVFGLFNGYVVLDDGSKLEINNLLGFAEAITNHY
ncbi:DUF2804 domain-containing protein [Hujiaoplasma nucleasis]|uniref:DUF2804 domain-containing protein n=1 Tax=Hujiaoplasma nucleasis TaxID=2725268 RepID=A0A7L6N3U3_9MOLU|nr:DUF2804 domain-containing protein [Hujiaoplasma nucleasis]QLY39907.1 DUF2804 domain-containing protein [Hujiaoplasma nucleasis]